MKDVREMTVEELTAALWSDAPTPGGGSVAALTGALAAALTGMVANLSQGPKFASVRSEMAETAHQVDMMRQRLLLAMQQDTESYSQYMMALAMPKSTEEEKLLRREAMQNGLKAAAQTPLQAAQTIMPLFALLEKVIRFGNPNAVTDALMGAMLARTGILAALLNVKINLAGIRDKAFVTDMEQKVQELECAAMAGERRVLSCSEMTSGMV